MALVAILWQFLTAIRNVLVVGVGEDLCVQKKNCPICKAFTAEQIQQLATPTKPGRKKEHSKKTVAVSPATSTPILVDPKDCKLIGRVGGNRVLEEIPAGKKKLPEDSPEVSKKKVSKPTSDDLKILDDKTFAVPLEQAVRW